MMMMKRWLLSFHVCGRLTLRIYQVDHGSKFGDVFVDVCKTYRVAQKKVSHHQFFKKSN